MTIFTSQPDEASGNDTYINSNNPTTNYNNTDLAIGEHKDVTAIGRILIKFDLSSIDNMAKIKSATLSLFIKGDESLNARTARVYRVLRNWVEAEATWNIYSTGNSWGTAGCANTTTDREATEIGTCDFTNAETPGTEKTFSLTAAKVQEWTAGTTNNYGVLIKMDTEADDLYYIHESNSATAGYRPKLVIEYLLAGQLIIWSSE